MPYGGLAGDQGAAGGDANLDGGVDVLARHVEVYEAVPGESGQSARDVAAAAGQPVYKVYETEVETLYPPNSDAAMSGEGDQTQPNLRAQRPGASSAGAGASASALADRDALDRTGRIEPRGLDASPAPYIQAPATTPRGDGMEAMIFVLVVLIVLVLLALLTVLFASGIVHIG
jgi:hypothetical protein